MALTFLQSENGEKSFKECRNCLVVLNFGHLSLLQRQRMKTRRCSIKVMDVCLIIVLSDFSCTYVTGDSPYGLKVGVKHKILCDW